MSLPERVEDQSGHGRDLIRPPSRTAPPPEPPSPAPLVWTRETPRERGIYWHWDPGLVAPEVRDFRYGMSPLPRPHVDVPRDEMRFQSRVDWWLGPLPVPEPPEEKL